MTGQDVFMCACVCVCAGFTPAIAAKWLIVLVLTDDRSQLFQYILSLELSPEYV